MHNAAMPMSIHLEDQESIVGPPVVSIAVEYAGVIVADPFTAHEVGEGILVDIVADDVMRCPLVSSL